MARTSLNGVHQTLGSLVAKVDGLDSRAAEREAAASEARVVLHQRLDEHGQKIEGVAIRVDLLEADRDRADALLLAAEKRTAWRFKALGALVGTVGLFGPLLRAYIVNHL